MARPPVDKRLRNIEEMESKIEDDVAIIKETLEEMKNGKDVDDDTKPNDVNEPDCLCDNTKEELEKIEA